MAPPDYAEDERRSFSFIRRHRSRLIAEARDFARLHPHRRPVALILPTDSFADTEFRSHLETVFSLRAPLVGIIPRVLALDIIRALQPSALDWLEDATSTGRSATLPIFAATRAGFVLAALSFDDEP